MFSTFFNFYKLDKEESIYNSKGIYGLHCSEYNLLLTKCIEYFMPELDVNKLTFYNSMSEIWNSLFKNDIFLKIYNNIIDEIPSKTDINIYLLTPTIYIKNVKNWIIHNITNNKITDYHNDIILKFETKFNYKLPTSENINHLKQIQSAAYTLHSLCIFFITTQNKKIEQFIKWLPEYYNELLYKINDIPLEYIPNNDIENMFTILKEYSPILDKETTSNDIFKTFYTLYSQHMSSKVTVSELYNIIYNYCNCFWNIESNNINNNIFVYKKITNIFIHEYLHHSQDLELLIQMFKKEDSDNINTWVENLENINIHINDSLTLTPSQSESHIDSQPESESKEERSEGEEVDFRSEDESEGEEVDFRSEDESEGDSDFRIDESESEDVERREDGDINPKILYYYDQLLLAKTDTDILTVIDNILPEGEHEISEEFVTLVLSLKNSRIDKYEMYVHLSNITNYPIYIN